MPAKSKKARSKKAPASRPASKKSTRSPPIPKSPEWEEDSVNVNEDNTPAVRDNGVPTTFAADAPDWLRKQAQGGHGFENVEQDDYVIPRIELVQKGSPVADDENHDIDPGDMVNSVTKELLAEKGEPLLIIPLVFDKNRTMWASKEPGSELLCRAPDNKTAKEPNGEDHNGEKTADCSACVFSQWDREEGKPPRCTEFKNFLCALPEYGMKQIALSMKSTSVKTAKRLNSALAATSMDMYAHKIALVSKREKEGKFSWFIFDFSPAGFVDDKAEFAKAKAMYDALAGRDYRVDEERTGKGGVDDEEAPF